MLDSSAVLLGRAEQCFHGIAMESESTSGAQRPRSIHQRGAFIIVLSGFCGLALADRSVEILEIKLGG